MSISPWFTVYRRIAEKLEHYYRNHPNDAASQFFQLCYQHTGFTELHAWIKVFPEIATRPGLDPIVIYASFSGQSGSKQGRVNKINLYLEILSGDETFEPIEDIDFEGCPMPRISKILSHRNEGAQNQIWQLFAAVMEKGREGLTSENFDDYKNWFGINIPSLTMFLFWIDSAHFLTLDTNTTSYLINEKLLQRPVFSYFDYAELLNGTKGQDYVEMSKIAYGLLRPSSAGTDNAMEMPEGKVKSRHLHANVGEFKLVGLKVYEATPEKYRKVINVDQAYLLSHAYDLSKEDFIGYDSRQDVRLYNVGDLSVSLSAIVGRNGSGKSTIVELIYLALNNLAKKHPVITAYLEFVPAITLDLYYAAENFYLIELRDEAITIYRYEPFQNGYGNRTEIDIKAFNLAELFYSVSVNYAHFSLNSHHIGTWINDLFHKNDAYQTPLVINPHRKDGNINVNAEEAFANSRLLANLLLDDSKDESPAVGMFRKLTDDRKAIAIKLSYDHSKLEYIYSLNAPTKANPEHKRRAKWDKADNYWDDFARFAQEVFKLPEQKMSFLPAYIHTWIETAYKYALKKVISISLRYERYEGEYDLKNNTFKDLKKYLEDLRDDTSHITYKLKQAINFIKFDHVRSHIGDFSLSLKKSVEIPIQKLAAAIDIAAQQGQDEQLEIIHLIPPSFLKPEVILTGGIKLSSLSSGEKQRIFAVSTIAYHLLNINSKMAQNDLIPYRFVNIIFDEIELYFHPDMQRTFIDYLLTYTGYLPLEQLRGLNMTFVTHSPFILSDIPSGNIMFLGGDRSGWNTFGANIHDMLADSFFLNKGVMGEIVKKTIISLSEFLTDKVVSHHISWTRESVYDVIQLIGEPLIQQRLRSLYFNKYDALDKRTRIEALRLELNQLENEEDL